jgi:hypothetical protein
MRKSTRSRTIWRISEAATAPFILRSLLRLLPRPARGERSDRFSDPGEGGATAHTSASELADAAPHPNPLPAKSGAREFTARAQGIAEAGDGRALSYLAPLAGRGRSRRFRVRETLRVRRCPQNSAREGRGRRGTCANSLSPPLLRIRFQMGVGGAQFRHRHLGGIAARDQVADDMIGFDRGACLDVAEHRRRHL